LKILTNSLGKEERLCSAKDIETLYKSGTSFLNHPVVVYYLPQPELKFTRVLVSVSKKKFKRAVDRNLLKRRLREAYRLNKSILEKKGFLGLVYIGQEALPFGSIEKSVKAGLQKLMQE
jgi:ribonuclease P protein component